MHTDTFIWALHVCLASGFLFMCHVKNEISLTKNYSQNASMIKSILATGEVFYPHLFMNFFFTVYHLTWMDEKHVSQWR